MMSQNKAGERFVATRADEVRRSPCGDCAHKHLDRATCDAFPTGIPIDILRGKDQHRTPVAGDHGIQFEPLAE